MTFVLVFTGLWVTYKACLQMASYSGCCSRHNTSLALKCLVFHCNFRFLFVQIPLTWTEKVVPILWLCEENREKVDNELPLYPRHYFVLFLEY